MWRRSTIASRESLADTVVWEYDLPHSGILNAVLFHLEATNGATSNLDAALALCVRSIQLVDGGRVLYSVSGEQAEMLTLLATGGAPRSIITEVLSVVQTFDAMMQFGLKMWDNEVGLDLSKLVNPKLRLDFDLTQVRAVGTSGFVSASGTMSAVAIINDGANVPTPASWVKSREIKSWTTAASGEEVTNAPVDGPWLRLLVRSHESGVNCDDALTRLRVSFDAGQFVAIDEMTEWAADNLQLMLGAWPSFAFDVFRADTDTFDTRHGGLVSALGESATDTDKTSVADFEDGTVTLNVNVLGAGTTQSSDGNILIETRVSHPYQTMVWDFGEMGLLNVAEYDRGDIVLTQANSGGAASIVLQQVMPNTQAA